MRTFVSQEDQKFLEFSGWFSYLNAFMTYFLKLFREKLKIENISIKIFSVCIRIQLRLQNEFGLITYVYQVVQAVPLRTLTPTVAKKISEKMQGHWSEHRPIWIWIWILKMISFKLIGSNLVPLCRQFFSLAVANHLRLLFKRKTKTFNVDLI